MYSMPVSSWRWRACTTLKSSSETLCADDCLSKLSFIEVKENEHGQGSITDEKEKYRLLAIPHEVTPVRGWGNGAHGSTWVLRHNVHKFSSSTFSNTRRKLSTAWCKLCIPPDQEMTNEDISLGIESLSEKVGLRAEACANVIQSSSRGTLM